MTEQTKQKPITNQRSKKEIREIVAEIDREVPDTAEFVRIMENKGEKAPVTPETPEPKEPEVVETTDEVIVEEPEVVQNPVKDDDLPVQSADDEPEVEEKPKRELPPIEQRYREAGQEAMILNSKNKKIMETIEEARNLPEPTLEELNAYAEQMGEKYDDLEPFAQNMLKESLRNKRQFTKISSLVDEEKKVNDWIKKVEDFIDLESTEEKYPGSQTSKEDILKYASKRSHIGSDLDLLIGGYMWKSGNEEKPVKRSVLLPAGKGATMPSSKPTKPTEPNENDAMLYRTKDSKKYKQMIKQGKFKITV